ncbi:prephenate dehydrogenase [Melghirimyces thermohalophilus]|uniref:Prephenate dehydrogenase n=1 Tax=Melghirimyces thermohalophilus TaxID=1236220 RepID=A0A1G6LTX6_9BACL|nr:prephenate dehydrogenase [Melghirimyces thermohalophilus]SDC46195.1 prephenate dehydrogenase [Melghirimyces thermohalophilus]
MAKAAVLGIGLIGGSLALCLKERTSLEVHGFDTSEESIRLAEAAGVIHRGHQSLESAVQGAEYIFLAVPVGTAPRLLDRLAELPLQTGCIISDVGSTKEEIVNYAEGFSQLGGTFIGGHPMAGSHRSGVQAAQSLLFENAYYVLTPLPETPLAEVQRLSGLLERATRARLVIMAPEHHDRVVGAISHLPHIVAAALVNQVAGYNASNEWFHRLAAGGFRDLTRVAASHPLMWRDILLSNRKAVLGLLQDWSDEMDEIRKAVAAGDHDQIESFFRRAKEAREGLPERRKGVILPAYELYVDVPDIPGVIGRVACLLGDKGVNLRNIGVMENREDRAGVLRLVFNTGAELEKAKRYLTESGYQVFDMES